MVAVLLGLVGAGACDPASTGERPSRSVTIVALVNGLSPLIISLIILLPLWLSQLGMHLPVSPYLAAILVALTATFLLGLFLGSISKTHWLWAGVRTLTIAILTISVISLFAAIF